MSWERIRSSRFTCHALPPTFPTVKDWHVFDPFLLYIGHTLGFFFHVGWIGFSFLYNNNNNNNNNIEAILINCSLPWEVRFAKHTQHVNWRNLVISQCIVCVQCTYKPRCAVKIKAFQVPIRNWFLFKNLVVFLHCCLVSDRSISSFMFRIFTWNFMSYGHIFATTSFHNVPLNFWKLFHQIGSNSLSGVVDTNPCE